MKSLCEFLEIEEDVEFKINGLNGKYKIRNNQIIYKQTNNTPWEKAWNNIDVNMIICGGIRTIKPVNFTVKTLGFLRLIDKKYKYIAKDSENIVRLYTKKPTKDKTTWVKGGFPRALDFINNSELFKHIHWEDEEPVCIDDYVDRK